MKVKMKWAIAWIYTCLEFTKHDRKLKFDRHCKYKSSSKHKL